MKNEKEYNIHQVDSTNLFPPRIFVSENVVTNKYVRMEIKRATQ